MRAVNNMGCDLFGRGHHPAIGNFEWLDRNSGVWFFAFAGSARMTAPLGEPPRQLCRSILCDLILDTPLSRKISSDGRIKTALKQRTGVLEVLFGVGFSGGDGLKRFVE